MQAGAVRALPATAPGTQGAPGSAAGSGAVRTNDRPHLVSWPTAAGAIWFRATGPSIDWESARYHPMCPGSFFVELRRHRRG